MQWIAITLITGITRFKYITVNDTDGFGYITGQMDMTVEIKLYRFDL